MKAPEKQQRSCVFRALAITEKRNRLRDAINKVARIVVNHCLDNRIGRIV